MNEPNTNENDRTRTEREQCIENTPSAEHLPLEGDPERVHEQSVIIGKTEPEREQEPVPEQTIPEQPQELPEQSTTIVQDMSHCVAKTDIDN